MCVWVRFVIIMAPLCNMGGGTRKCVCAWRVCGWVGVQVVEFSLFRPWTSSVFTSHGGLAISCALVPFRL